MTRPGSVDRDDLKVELLTEGGGGGSDGGDGR